MEILQNNLGHTSLDYVEQSKIELSVHDTIAQKLDFLSDCPLIDTSVSEFVRTIENDVEKIKQSMLQCLIQAQIKNTDISLVIMTGGSTQIPYIARTISDMFPNALLSDSNKMASVGLGLAYDAMRRFAEPQHTK